MADSESIAMKSLESKRTRTISSNGTHPKRRRYWFTGVPPDYRLPSRKDGGSSPTADTGEDVKPVVTFGALVSGFANFTTSHGIPHIFFSDGIIKRGTWLILTIIFTICLIGHLAYLSQTYADYQVATDIQIVERRSLLFPAITICNNNAMKRSNMPERINKIVSSRRGNVINGTDKIYSNVQLRRSLSEEMAEMGSSQKYSIGYSLKELVIYCSFNGEDCVDEDFWSFHDRTYGNCYTFNSGKVQGATTHRSKLAGPLFGLNLVLNIGVYEYIPFLTEDAGVRILVHHSKVMPFPDLTGISASPGYTSNIAIKQSVYERLSKPFGNCTRLNMNQLNAFAEPFDVGYSQWACLNTCYQRRLVNECGCYTTSIPYDNSSIVFNMLKIASGPCKRNNQQERKCEARVEKELLLRNLRCEHCFQPCRERRFESSLSTSKFPANTYVDDFVKQLKVNHPQLHRKLLSQYSEFDSAPQEAIAANFLKLNVFFGEMTLTSYTQTAAYGPVQFASDIGGTFGLWIGWSLMTIYEFFGFLMDVCVYMFYKRRAKNKHAGGSATHPLSAST